MVDHTVKAYDKELEALERRIAEMGGIAEKMVIDAMDALANRRRRARPSGRRNRPPARRPAARDRGAGDPDHRARASRWRSTCARSSARSASPAISSASATSPRTSPSARSRSALEARVPRAIVGLRHMNDVATELMKDVLDAYAQRDVERARAVWERDAELDALEDFGVSRPAHPHDGRPAQHLVLRASAVLLQEHRADRRPRHQYRRDRVLSRHRGDASGRAAEGPARISTPRRQGARARERGPTRAIARDGGAGASRGSSSSRTRRTSHCC